MNLVNFGGDDEGIRHIAGRRHKLPAKYLAVKRLHPLFIGIGNFEMANTIHNLDFFQLALQGVRPPFLLIVGVRPISPQQTKRILSLNRLASASSIKAEIA